MFPISLLPVFTEDIFLKFRPFPEIAQTPFQKHWHEIVFAYLFYQTFQLFCPLIAKKYFGKIYSDLPQKTKVNFDIHMVSMVQCVVSILAIIPMWNHPYYAYSAENPNLGILGSYDYAGFVSAITIGYFIWDLYVCLRYFHLFGFGFLFHGVAALYVFGTTLIPYCQPWIPAFLLFELSSPFVNINWFASRLPKGTFNDKFVIINGLLLMVTFFVVRIIWGFYAVLLVAKDMYMVKNQITIILPITILFLNFFLNVLNVYWFYKMVVIAKKQFKKKAD